MNNYKRVLSLILAIIMVLGVFTIGAFATDDITSVANDDNNASVQNKQDADDSTTADETADESTDAPSAVSDQETVKTGTDEAPVTDVTEEDNTDTDPEVVATAANAYLNIENIKTSDGSNYTTSILIKKGTMTYGSTITSVVLVTNGKEISVKSPSNDFAKDLETGVTVTGLTAGITYEVKINDVVAGKVTIPASPVNLKVDGKTSVEYKQSTTSKLTWSAVAGAVGYEVYKYDPSNKKWQLYKTVTTTNCTDKITSKDKKYTYKVFAVYENDTVEGKMRSVASNSVTVINKTVPGTVTKLKGYKYKAAQYSGKGDSKVISPNTIKLTWNKVSGATGYRIYRYDNHTKKYKVVKSTTSTTTTCGNLKNGYKYYFKVKAVRNGVESAKFSNRVGGYTISYQTSKIHPIWYKGVITSKAKCFSSKSSKKVLKSIGKGTKVKVLQRANGRSQILTSSGKVYWVNRSKCHYTAQVYNSKKDWTTAAKESYVKNYSSKTKYLIYVSQYTQRVNVFQGKKGNWKLIKTGLCATGRMERKTPMGTFKVFQKEKGWFYSGYKNAPVVHFAGRNSFHSRPTYYNGKVRTKTIGKPASNGCVRMEQDYVDWIYKYVPLGTTVINK